MDEFRKEEHFCQISPSFISEYIYIYLWHRSIFLRISCYMIALKACIRISCHHLPAIKLQDRCPGWPWKGLLVPPTCLEWMWWRERGTGAAPNHFFIKNHPKWNVRFGAKTVRYGEKTCAVYEVFNSQCGSYKYESEIPWISFEFLLVVDRNHALCILNSQNLNSLKVHGKNLKSHGSFESFVWCFKIHLKLHMYVLVIGFFVSRTIWES